MSLDILLRTVKADEHTTYFDITAKNKGDDDSFHGQCEIAARRPPPGATRLNSVFTMAWFDVVQTSRERKLAKDESGTVRLGYVVTAGQIFVDFSEWSNAGLRNFSREYIGAQNEIEWDLDVIIFKAGGGNVKKGFTLKRHTDGAFSVTPRELEGRD